MNIKSAISPIAFIIAILNVVVFLAWHKASNEAWMLDNFLISWEALQAGRYWTLLTAVFSHNLLWHLALNMMVLLSFGPTLERELGAVQFLAFYLFAGVFSSICHALVSNYVLQAPALPALGASGALSGVVLLFALKFPRSLILIFGLIPVRALWGCAIFIAFDSWGLYSQYGGGGMPIGHAAHLGGAVAGIVYFFLVARRQTAPISND